jgi:hypothetical protein
MNAVGANQRSLHLTVEVGAHSLQVGSPEPLGFVVRVTYAVADGSAFAADFTNSRHL